MRDSKRIDEIVSTIDRIWKDNPDLRLGQLITIAIKPNDPCPEVFHAKDEMLLEGLINYEQKRP